MILSCCNRDSLWNAGEFLSPYAEPGSTPIGNQEGGLADCFSSPEFVRP